MPLGCAPHVCISISKLYTDFCVHRVQQASPFCHVPVPASAVVSVCLFLVCRNDLPKGKVHNMNFGAVSTIPSFLANSVKLCSIHLPSQGHCSGLWKLQKTASVSPGWNTQKCYKVIKETSIKKGQKGTVISPSLTVSQQKPDLFPKHNWPLQDGFTPLFPKLRQSQLFLLQQNILCRTTNLSSASNVAHSISKNTSATLGGFHLPLYRIITINSWVL